MSTVVLIQAQPRFAASGTVADIRLAGGGTKAYFQLGFGDWRSGIARPPRFSTAIGFDQRGLTGGALPSTGGFEFSSSDKALFSALGGMVWEGARVTVTTGDDEDIFPDYAAQLVGTVAAVKTDKATLSFVIADLSIDLDKPVIAATFSGSGALEGGDDAVGRAKRRSWGTVFGIEGRLLDKAYNVYEFGDPAYPLQAFKALKDKGRTGDMVVVPWQGSGLATLNALRDATTPSGGGAVAPSIACAKWWTTPAGPLTADLEGEVGAGYVGSAVAIAARVALTYSTAIQIDEASRATAETWPVAVAPAGVHCAETSESVANLLDRLLLPLSIVWILDGAGRMTFRRLTWTNPVESLRADTIKREVVFKPLKTRRYGYQRNYRPHAESEISAAIPADEILFPDGSTAADLADTVADLNRDLEAVVSDAVLSRVEKPIWIDRYDEIIAQQTALDAKYVALGSPPELSDAKNAATAFVNALKLYLDGLTPSWRDTKTDTAIVKDDFAGYWRNAIAAIAQYIAAVTGRPGKDGRDGVNGTNGTPGRDGTNGTAAYFHVAYANSANGAVDFTTGDPGSRLYIGVLVDQTLADSEDYRVYTWSRLTGADGLNGTNGTPGAPGANGQTSYVHFAYANSADGSVDFSTDNPVGRAYLGAYSDFTLADSTDFRSYTWSLVKGADGRDGVNGKDGAPGRDGINGGSAYFHVAYANSADGSTDFTTGAPGTRTYLGVAVDQSPTDPEDFRVYAWSLIKGRDGLNGNDGTPGPRGADGRQSYVHFAYSNSPDGSVDFSTDDPANRAYIGVYSDYTVADSGDFRVYTWSRAKGTDGAQGAQGPGGPGGPAGNDGFSVIASPAAFVVPSFANGTSKPAWTGGSCRIALFKGGQEVVADSYSYAEVTNISSIAMSGQNVTFADVVGDKGEFVARATRAGVNYNIRVPVSRTTDGSAAFSNGTTFAGTQNDASVTASTAVPGGRTTTIAASATYEAQRDGEGRAVLAIYWRNASTGGPLNFLGQEQGSVASYPNLGSSGEPNYQNNPGAVSVSRSFTSPSPDAQIEYQAVFSTNLGTTVKIAGKVSIGGTG